MEKHMTQKEYLNMAEMLKGSINRMCVTDDSQELFVCSTFVQDGIIRLYHASVERIKSPNKRLK